MLWLLFFNWMLLFFLFLFGIIMPISHMSVDLSILSRGSSDLNWSKWWQLLGSKWQNGHPGTSWQERESRWQKWENRQGKQIFVVNDLISQEGSQVRIGDIWAES
jgi:hypothetical protein